MQTAPEHDYICSDNMPFYRFVNGNIHKNYDFAI